ncbi:sigma-54 dependent transcriptional regulator [uncultured Tissierella sp.]|jgi:two-component system response regulator AtoC|uniref:sigma-54-dependent transcriptional regulator n=1 Tax=uncultured Tissierella sp. TaxID=448160 RepID=UPI002804ACE3|nr:sigma-54 dependent transcriptional regulator [uncultured Tissierella sp.]MDU5081690.1 sigma-54 dependent transcriptional regulator [Bacillota bacterium]
MEKILIADDEKNICDSLKFALEDSYEVFTTQDANQVMEILYSENIDVVLLDLKIGKIDGITVLKDIKSKLRNVQVIVVTAYGSIKSSINAMKEGAFHYITKPIDMEELYLYVEKAIEYKNLNYSLTNLKKILHERYSFKEIVGNSDKLRLFLNRVEKVIDIDSTVLITGESGTGKDLIAKALHFQGNRKDENFIVVNCAAIPENLLESELFGYEKGTFTGADKKKIGKIQLANNGTLFLDEIAEMDLQLQAKILRIVEDMEVTPLGSNRPVKIDVRIVAATNKDLEAEVKSGKFREDLFYRLNVINLEVPPLRERKGDIPVLLNYFLNKYNNKLHKEVVGFSKDVIETLEKYKFPGNVRELENLVEMLVALSDNKIISKESLPERYYANTDKDYDNNDIRIRIGTNLKEIERIVILKTLDYFQGNRRMTAESLQISERNLQYKIKEYNIVK